MTGVRAALEDLRLNVAAIPARQMLPAQSRRPTHVILQKILAGRLALQAEPAKDRLEEVWGRLNVILRAGGSPAQLSSRDLGDLIWLLWAHGRRACLVPGLVEAIQAATANRTRYLKRLIDAWLRDYAADDDSIRQTGAWLATAVMRADPAALAVWQRAQRRHDLFGSPDAPASVARACMAADDPSILADLGFNTAARTASGFMRAVVYAAGAMLPASMSGPTADEAFERVQPLFVSEDALRFEEPKMRGVVADALVGAWERGTPPDKLRDGVLHFLVNRLRDPRIHRHRWDRASPRTREIVCTWLARVTLSAFFSIIGQYADASGMGHQWVARRKFWSACLGKGWVADAWLVLGPNVLADVSRNQTLGGSYGALNGYGVHNHSTLLMRIGDTVFAEWSHNGSLYAWSASSLDAPKFYRPSYSVDDLKSLGLSFPPPSDRPDLATLHGPGLQHHADTWRGRVAALLKQRENRRIEPWEWA